jgi:general secretion pathway protein I
LRRRGFTLLEVLVAIAIVGLGLSVILSSQVGLFSSAEHAHHLSLATGLARCKMNEVELKLLRDGYPITDLTEEGECCEEESQSTYTCEWKVERIELPEIQEAMTVDGAPAGSASPVSSAPSLMDKLSSLQTGAADGGVDGLSGMLGDASGDLSGIAPMVMGMVYPTLKPMLEASIRRVTVAVRWREGRRDKDFTIVQFVTDPQQGGIDPAADEKMEQMGDALGGALGGTPAGANSSPPKGEP